MAKLRPYQKQDRSIVMAKLQPNQIESFRSFRLQPNQIESFRSFAPLARIVNEKLELIPVPAGALLAMLGEELPNSTSFEHQITDKGTLIVTFVNGDFRKSSYRKMEKLDGKGLFSCIQETWMQEWTEVSIVSGGTRADFDAAIQQYEKAQNSFVGWEKDPGRHETEGGKKSKLPSLRAKLPNGGEFKLTFTGTGYRIGVQGNAEMASLEDARFIYERFLMALKGERSLEQD